MAVGCRELPLAKLQPLRGGLSIPAPKVWRSQRGSVSMRGYRLPVSFALWLLPDYFELLELRDHEQGEESPSWQRSLTLVIRRRYSCAAKGQEQRKTHVMLT